MIKTRKRRNNTVPQNFCSMRKFLFGLLITCSFFAKAQVYNNEWIDYSKPYYKFKLGKDGLFRIGQAVLANAGLGGTPAEQFQLWRNGVQVPIYTSVPTGALSSGGYIEFWGQMNDGKPDKQLYRKPSYQLNDKWSLLTDTATYFLTVNSDITSNLRLENAANNVAGNTLPAEPYFMYTVGKYFRDRINSGYAVPVGEYLYSSSYDNGEGWSSVDIATTAGTAGVTYGNNIFTFSNLFVAGTGPAPSFKIAVSGNAINQRRYKVEINGDSVLGNQVDYFNQSVDSTTFSINTIVTNNAAVTVTNLANVACYPAPTGCQTDRMVIHKYELTYPRLFDFGNAKNFEFTLPASAVGNFLQITDFAFGTTPPVLYDLSNGKRYMADLSATPALKFVLPPSSVSRSLVLVSEDATNVNDITSLETRNFINYTSTSSNVGDYLIISNPVLFNGAGGSNPVEDYRSYRSSVAGGSYNVKIYLADELIDQFGFGIKKHPLGIRNFLLYARKNYAIKPKQVFIIGKGVNYLNQRSLESSSDPAVKSSLARLNLIPTFGWPASDILLTAEPGSSLPEIPVGRLSVIDPQEVSVYLNKVKEYELAQKNVSPNSADKEWMKNVVHIVGASDDALGQILSQSMNNFKSIITDTLFGANVSTFSKSTANAVEQLTSNDLTNLFNHGISLITYFGHSSSTTLEFNLDNPENYNNQGKYPLFIGLGCNAGNFFNYNTIRFIKKETISEKYVLAPDRGTIGFIASTHFGIVHYLDIWNTRAYKQIASTSYGKTIGEIMKRTAEDVFTSQSQEDFYARANVEQSELNGDPALTLNTHSKPDYVIENPMVKVSPGFVSVADASFKVDAKFLNIGKAPKTKIVVEVKRQFPDQSEVIVKRDTIPGILYIDSISVDVPIDPAHDKGLNKIIVTIDADNNVDELFETNNSITKEIMIYEDEARPVYPYNFAIINKSSVKLIASTANPFSPVKQYQMELDTTELFNSPFKITKAITAPGGTLTFDAGINFINGTVYYWRVAPVPASGPFSWNTASFVYLANSDLGFNQSHAFQHLKSGMDRITFDSASRTWKIKPILNEVFIKNGVWVTATGQEGDLVVNVNGSSYIRSVCNFGIVMNVFDKNTFKPWQNETINGQGLYGSRASNCAPSRMYNFEFNNDTSGRRKAMEFLRNVVPDDDYVVFRIIPFTNSASNEYIDKWINDETIYGPNNSLYKELKNNGLTIIDSFYRLRVFSGVFKKGNNSFPVAQGASVDQYDVMALAAFCPAFDSLGFVTSPPFGPAKKWKEAIWSGNADSSNITTISLMGIKTDGSVDTLRTDVDASKGRLDISTINAQTYPSLKLQLKTLDPTAFTPYQLKSWRLTYDPAPEGAMAPNEYYSIKDTVDVAEPLDIKMAFKNVSEAVFSDSLKVKVVVTDRNNIAHVLPIRKQRPLSLSPDTLQIAYSIDTRQLTGANSMYVEVNPDNDQPEQYHFNNFFYRTFYVRPDTLNPLMDVTFDNIHILNNDIVSSKPNIMIKLKDESKWFLLNDTSTISVKVKFPDGNIKEYHFDGTSMQYLPAQQAPNKDNTATVSLKPDFDQDGDYELTVSGKDMSQNKAGAMQYRVAFQVFNKPMISNMLNYPNPFTTSTAFVFTVTGSEVPQNIKIQILTVTGKVVREITKDELGPLHVGRNITEFKWDGTDQYGQKLGNGVYLYRVVTNLNGKSLDKFTGVNENTDKYFNKGYGKMYLMR
jgi:flagellar hook assembly protein FlgD